MKGNTVLKVFLILLVSVFIIHQVYSSVYKPISTVSAEYYESNDGLDFTGYIIREETPVSLNSSGSLHYVVSDGERVAKDGVIAYVYDSTQASVINERIEELKNQISDIEEIQGYNNQKAADIDQINGKVVSALNSLERSCAYGNFENTRDRLNAFLTALNRRSTATGEQTDFSSNLASLKEELNSLTASLPSPKASVTAARSGYFVSTLDGYESVLKTDDISKIDEKFLTSLKPEEKSDSYIGKIVSDYEWYIAALVDVNDSLKYKEGDSLTINTTLKSGQQLPVTVKKINIMENSKKAVIIFSCEQMNSSLAVLRTSSMRAISKSYSGLRIPKKALRVVDGKAGVYVLSGINVKFVPVTVTYNTGDYIICEQKKSNDNVLRIYDAVIVKGKNLYDGKVIS